MFMRRNTRRAWQGIAVIALITVLWASCGGGGSTGGGGGGGSPGTAPGVYTLSVNGSVGADKHSVSLALKVQ